ncbi:ring-cleaving dioxygenase [Fulvimarina sp. 2208YS6-2-32]|uniref:Ring-cleaving dioxygenase n=1 Tax=Fulvimarina uroteuthidis TaxID=3098149 RepID=A0ABU5I2E5_9HYPH|nr:ring-cleaving dioxygenase [Fulvimarina sp. 2208YS6-2-32]MDY8109543.1 ring-cleaving dioxygenase [Fulvimarina sp. 2208YS6-2-32]
MALKLTGFHHLTAITANAPQNLAFYRDVLGLRLVKKTVNQDDTSAYHLFYADGDGSPGTDITFFDWPAAPERRGSGSVSRTGLRIRSTAAIAFWEARLKAAGVPVDAPRELDGRTILDFEDPEGQRLRLVVDPQGPAASPWTQSPVPVENQIQGLGPITLSIAQMEPTEQVLTHVMNMEKNRTYTDGETAVHVFTMNEGGSETELHVAVEPHLRQAGQGAGAVHHVAFRTPDREGLDAWTDRLRALRVPSSGEVERFYFRSLYFRVPAGILFEIATDGPGFAVDEPAETVGESLSLPPFLEGKRDEIEAGLLPLEAG